MGPLQEIDLVDLLEAWAHEFAAVLAGRPSVKRIEAPDFLFRAKASGALVKPVIWRNEIFVGPEFRWAHVEYFAIGEQIGVIHVCVFPSLDCHAPIFGFDIISGGRKATGAFLDLSPTTAEAAEIVDSWAAETKREVETFQEKRRLPDWAAAVLSEHAVAIRPVSPSEVEAVLTLAQRSLALWLDRKKPVGRGVAMLRAQQRYVEAQRRNEHTLRMLAGCVGADIARHFVNEWLFPEIVDPDVLLASEPLAPHECDGVDAL